MGLGSLIALVAILVFAAASFFFSLAESSLFSLSKWHARHLAESKPGPGATVVSLLSQPQDVLASIALGNTGAAAAMLLTGIVASLQGHWPATPTILGLLVLILFGCEVLPKSMGVRHPEAWALRVACPLQWFLFGCRPLARLAQAVNRVLLKAVVPGTVQPQPGVTDAEYQELLEMAFQQGTLALSEKEIILQIISLDRRTAREVMKPRAQMAAISDDLPIEDMIAAARKFRHRRLPIYDETPDTIVGVLNTRALLLNPNIDLADAIEFPSFVPESMNLLQLLKSLQKQQRGLAIVLDEFGGTAGIVAMEDILEALIGPIRGELASESFFMEKIAAGRWRASGMLRLDDFRREYPPLGEVPEVETVGGLFTSLLEVVPKTGDSVQFRGLRLTAAVTDERRVREVIIETVKP